ncbi:hypothetical protein P879_08234 [Paragonimus westermani]|uniref:Uncharacterized protein n=1 Tax=Paragonimus westermani TaxID=34504 RepID=A0A8T0DHF5_9TREM|nr:hypothetical protein P879_08234 [Paragonimus westermani]
MCSGQDHRTHDRCTQKGCSVENREAGHHGLMQSFRCSPSGSHIGAVRESGEFTNVAQHGVILGMTSAEDFGPKEDAVTRVYLSNGYSTTLVSRNQSNQPYLTEITSEMELTTIVGARMTAGRTVSLNSCSSEVEDETEVKHANSVPSVRMKPQLSLIREDVSEWPHLEGVHCSEIANERVRVLIDDN